MSDEDIRRRLRQLALLTKRAHTQDELSRVHRRRLLLLEQVRKVAYIERHSTEPVRRAA